MNMRQYEVFARSPRSSKISPFESNNEGRGGFALVLRYAGCNLRCPLCYAWRYAWFPDKEGYKYGLNDVLKAIDKLCSLNLQGKINWIRIQGGEPCLSLERTSLTLRVCGKALQVLHEIGLNRYSSTRAIIQTNGIFFSALNNNEKAINLIKEKLRAALCKGERGRIIFEVSFKDPTGKREWRNARVLEEQVIGFKTLLNKIIKPLWDEGFENVALYIVAGLGPSIDFHNTSIIPIDPYSLPKEYPLFHPKTWSKEFRTLYDLFIGSIVPQYGAYKDFRNNSNTNNGMRIPLEEFEPNKFQKAWLSGYAGKYQEYGLKIGVDVPVVSSILRRLDDQLDPQWIGLCKQKKNIINRKWLNLLKNIPLAHNPSELKKLIEEMKEWFYPTHPKGHYPYL